MSAIRLFNRATQSPPSASVHRCADLDALHFAVWQLCTALWNMACLPRHCPTAEMHHPPHTALTSFAWSPSTSSKHQWMSVGAIVSSRRNSAPPLVSICTSVSDPILSDCPSAASHTATTQNGALLGSFSLYCHSSRDPEGGHDASQEQQRPQGQNLGPRAQRLSGQAFRHRFLKS